MCCPSEKVVPKSDNCIIVHGGVGVTIDAMVVEKVRSCRRAATIGYELLQSGKSSVEAVEAALRWLEDDEYFNCGYGSVLNISGGCDSFPFVCV